MVWLLSHLLKVAFSYVLNALVDLQNFKVNLPILGKTGPG